MGVSLISNDWTERDDDDGLAEGKELGKVHIQSISEQERVFYVFSLLEAKES